MFTSRYNILCDLGSVAYCLGVLDIDGKVVKYVTKSPVSLTMSPFSFEGFVLVLSLYRGYQYCYRRDRIPILTNISPILLRDSAIYSLL